MIQDMYGGTRTRVKTRCGRTEYFEVKVGLHQGSALSPLLFIIIMDVLAEEARTKPPWAMLFADDLVLVSETVEEVEEELERWRAVIENKGLRISRSKTEYLVPSHQQGVVKLEGEPLPSVNSFKYLGSVIDGSGGCGKDVDGRIKVAWSRWRDLSGVIYDKKVPMKLKSKLYKTVVRPAMVYGSECWALRKQEEQRLHTTEMKMLRWSQGKTRKDRIMNETIRGIARVTPIKSVLAQKRLSWYGHVMRREETHITRSTLNMTVMGTRPRGRPKMRWLDRLKSDMRIYSINPEMATDREHWAVMVKNVDTT